jgi:hypothetical protein
VRSDLALFLLQARLHVRCCQPSLPFSLRPSLPSIPFFRSDRTPSTGVCSAWPSSWSSIYAPTITTACTRMYPPTVGREGGREEGREGGRKGRQSAYMVVYTCGRQRRDRSCCHPFLTFPPSLPPSLPPFLQPPSFSSASTSTGPPTPSSSTT